MDAKCAGLLETSAATYTVMQRHTSTILHVTAVNAQKRSEIMLDFWQLPTPQTV
jgi:hypothetical protein